MYHFIHDMRDQGYRVEDIIPEEIVSIIDQVKNFEIWNDSDTIIEYTDGTIHNARNNATPQFYLYYPCRTIGINGRTLVFSYITEGGYFINYNHYPMKFEGDIRVGEISLYVDHMHEITLEYK